MKTPTIFFGFFIIIVLMFMSYLLIQDCKDCLYKNVRRPRIQNRCHPEIDDYKPEKKITLFEEKTSHITNKGFVNELIYKPKTKLDNVNIDIKLIDDKFKNIPLNQTCKTSTELPIANINIPYFLSENTSKLEIIDNLSNSNL